MKIKVSNPYWDKEYEVIETKQYVENSIKNVLLGNEDFIVLHTSGNEMPLLISPKNFASVEILD